MNNLISRYTKQVTRLIKTRYILLRDDIEVFFGYRHALTPPKRYDYINIGANEQIGKEFLQFFVKQGGLKPADRVLEIGSGFGRMAIPLSTFLSQEGSYEGLEIIKDGVNWCQSKFAPKFLNFKFQRIDVFNNRYNPTGNQLATEYKFPFENATFDFVYLTSVFTHMYPDEIENYLSEISRVLKRGGKCLITFYILNDSSLNNINQNKGTYNFKYEVNDYRIEDKANPLYQIAFTETFIRNLYAKCSISIIEPIQYGSWSGRTTYLSFQDIIVGVKK